MISRITINWALPAKMMNDVEITRRNGSPPSPPVNPSITPKRITDGENGRNFFKPVKAEDFSMYMIEAP